MTSDPDPVQVAVELLDSFSDELDEINAHLQEIDNKSLSVSLDIDDNGDVSEVKARLEALEKKLNSVLDIDVRGAGEAFTIKELLDDDMESTLHINTDDDNIPELGDKRGPTWKGVDPPNTGYTSSEGIQKSNLNNILNGQQRKFPYDRFAAQRQMKNMGWSLHDQEGPVDPKTYIRDNVNTKPLKRTRENLNRLVSVDVSSENRDGGSDGSYNTETGLLRRLSGILGSSGVSDTERVGEGGRGSVFDKLLDSMRRLRTSVEETGVEIDSHPATSLPGRSESDFHGDYRTEVDRIVHQDISHQMGPDEKLKGISPSWSGGFETEQFHETHADIDSPEGDFLRSIREGTAVDIQQPDTRFGNNLFGDDRAQALNLGQKWDFFNRADRDSELSFRTKTSQRIRGSKRKIKSIPQRIRSTKSNWIPDIHGSKIVSDLGKDLSELGSTGESAKERLEGIDDPFKNLGQQLKKFAPSMRLWWNLLGLLMPLVIALAGGAAGLAVALGAVGVAAAAIGGLGLLGLEDAGKRIKKLKKELKASLAPASDTFAPFVSHILDRLPNMIGQLTDPLKGLTDYEGFIENALGGSVDLIRRIIMLMDNMSGKIQQVAGRFGGAIGDTIIGLLRGAVNEIYNNQEAYIQLGRAIVEIITFIYQLSKVIAFTVAQLSGIFNILGFISDLLSNKLVAGILSAIASFTLFYFIVKQTSAALVELGALGEGGLFSGIIAGVYGAVEALYEYIEAAAIATGVSEGLAAAIALTGVGAILIGAGIIGAGVVSSMSGPKPGASGMPSGTGGQFGGMSGMSNAAGSPVNNNITINGDVDDSVYSELEHKFPEKYEKQSKIERNSTPKNSQEAESK